MNFLPSQPRYWVVGIALLGLASLPMAWNIQTESRQYLRLLQSREALRMFVIALRACEAISTERDPASTLLGQYPPRDGALRIKQLRLKQLRRARQISDRRLAALAREMEDRSCQRCAGMAESLRLVRTRLDAARRVMDALRDDRARQREHGAILQAEEGMIAAAEPLTAILNHYMREIVKRHAESAEPILLARSIAEMREYAGRLGSLLVEPLATGRHLTRADRERIAITEGRILQLRDLTTIRLSSLSYRAAMEADLDAVTSAYFHYAFTHASQLLDFGDRSAHTMGEPASFTDSYQRGMRAIVRFRDSALQAAVAPLNEDIDAQRHKLVAVASIDGLILAALIGAFFMFGGKYVSPLEKVTRAISSLGLGGGGLVYATAACREAMMTSLSHDMRSPQASILALLDMTRATEMHRPTPELFAKIETLARRTLSMVDDFVRLSELQVLTYRPTDVDAYGIVLDACDDLTAAARMRGISLVLSNPDGQPYTVSAEPDSLYRAIANVLDNAIKYGPANEAVHCTVRRIRRQIEVVITDRGPGIHPRDMPYLFERFRRFPAASSRSVPGNGLGLAFARAAIRKARGQIRCHSVPGEGTEFTIALPARR